MVASKAHAVFLPQLGSNFPGDPIGFVFQKEIPMEEVEPSPGLSRKVKRFQIFSRIGISKLRIPHLFSDWSKQESGNFLKSFQIRFGRRPAHMGSIDDIAYESC